MEITDIRIKLIENPAKMKATASITFDNEFVVHDLKIIDGCEGIFVAMPSRKMSDGFFKDIAHPLTTETRKKIRTQVLQAYEKALATATP